jgi:hypothetical protein
MIAAETEEREKWCTTELTHMKDNEVNPPAITVFGRENTNLSRANQRTGMRLAQQNKDP